MGERERKNEGAHRGELAFTLLIIITGDISKACNH